MTRLLPYPLLSASLLVMWLLLNRLSIGHVILGSGIAFIASWAMAQLQPAKPRVRRWGAIVRLIVLSVLDVLKSNVAVARVILQGRRNAGKAGFMTISLQLRDRTGLAVLACIINSTPGTAWVEYDSAGSRLMIHVLDLVTEQEWIDLIKQRYERLLLEIFE